MKKLLLLLFIPLFSTAQQVTTFAGFGAGYQDGSLATAQFSGMHGACFDAAGNMYVSDTGNNRIRKISADGIVTTLAGSAEGFADGVGTAAMFNLPRGICIDADGNLYVADQNNHRIRKITPDGTVTTIAGSSTAGYVDGIGSLAKFYFPVGICIDSAGNLYIADSLNHKIRKITTTGFVSTLAGSTTGFADGTGIAAKFRFPSGICVDGSNNLYITDQNNHKIRKITSTGIVSTVAGTTWGYTDGLVNVAQFAYPSGICIDTNSNLYIANTGTHNIRKIDTSGNVTTYAGGSTAGNVDGFGTIARFTTPAGITIKSDGTIYVVQDNGRIRKIVNILSNTIFNKNNVTIYPNPCKQKFNVVTDEIISSAYIYNTIGNLVYVTECINNEVYIKDKLNKGIYLVQLISNNYDIFVSKLIIE